MNSVAVVIGAGANELAAAHYLARAGLRAVVLEGGETPRPGGNVYGWVPPRLARDLALDSRGLELQCPDPWASAPLAGGGRLDLWRDMARSIESIRKVSARDAARWPAFCERMARLARLWETVCLAPPPAPLGRGWRELAGLALLGLRIRGLGRQGMEDLLRLAPMPVADFLDEWFESDALKGVLGAAGIMNLCQGPRSGGTALRLLHHHLGNPPGVFRAPASNVRDVLAALPGIEVRSAGAAGITVRDGRVGGVKLADGEELNAALVVSGADPKRTLLELADPAWLDPELVRAVRGIRSRGVAARVTLTLERAPGWSTLAIAPSLDYLERAYDEVKYGNVSREPYLEARSAGAANGASRVEVTLQYAPYAPADGVSDDIARARLGRLTLETLSRHVPDLGAAAVESALSPRDLEARYGYPEGQAEQVEPALDQLLWMRPLPELARYRTPIEGLYLCGAGMHPGGGIPGRRGIQRRARELLRDLKIVTRDSFIGLSFSLRLYRASCLVAGRRGRRSPGWPPRTWSSPSATA